MNETNKTILIVGGLALAGWLVYKKMTGAKAPSAASSPIVHQSTGNSVSTQTAGGASGMASNLGQYASTISSGVNAVDSLYNQVYDWFGGNGANSTTGSSTGAGG